MSRLADMNSSVQLVKGLQVAKKQAVTPNYDTQKLNQLVNRT